MYVVCAARVCHAHFLPLRLLYFAFLFILRLSPRIYAFFSVTGLLSSHWPLSVHPIRSNQPSSFYTASPSNVSYTARTARDCSLISLHVSLSTTISWRVQQQRLVLVPLPFSFDSLRALASCATHAPRPSFSPFHLIPSAVLFLPRLTLAFLLPSST